MCIEVGALCLTQFVEVELRQIDDNDVEWAIRFRRHSDQAPLHFESRPDKAHEFDFTRYDKYARPMTPLNACARDSASGAHRTARLIM
jgi:hypothetical protein